MGKSFPYANYKTEHVLAQLWALTPPTMSWIVFTEVDVWWNQHLLPSYLHSLEAQQDRYQQAHGTWPHVVAGGGNQMSKTDRQVYGCFSIFSRAFTELLGSVDPETGWSFLQWCRDDLLLARMEQRAPSLYSCTNCVKKGSLYNGDHLLSWCLQPGLWRSQLPDTHAARAVLQRARERVVLWLAESASPEVEKPRGAPASRFFYGYSSPRPNAASILASRKHTCGDSFSHQPVHTCGGLPCMGRSNTGHTCQPRDVIDRLRLGGRAPPATRRHFEPRSVGRKS